MLFFRKNLVRIKKEYNSNKKRLFLYSSLASILFIVIGLAIDLFVPFNSWGNIIRTVVLIPTSISMFVFGYGVSLYLHNRQIAQNPEWQPYRARLSPTWRRRVLFIVGAIILVGVYATTQSVGYTPISSFFAAIVIALFAFVRTTREEAQREELGIPDERDVKYDQQMKKIEDARAEAARRKEERKQAQKEKETKENVFKP